MYATMNQQSCIKRENVFIKEINIFQSKIGKFLYREPLKIPDSVIQLLKRELHNSDNKLYYCSQVDSLTIPILEQLLKRINSSDTNARYIISILH